MKDPVPAVMDVPDDPELPPLPEPEEWEYPDAVFHSCGYVVCP